MSFAPTDEQQAALDGFATGGSLVLEAGAGTGKTSTLKLMAKSDTTRRGIYLAYNKAIATDAKQDFPRNVECATAHSFAFRAVGVKYKDRLNGPRVTSRQACNFLGITQTLDCGDGMKLKPWQLARLAMDTVNRFCYSADPVIMGKHVPFLPGTEKVRDELRLLLVPFAQKAWDDLQKKSGTLRFQHDHYLKLWVLSNPVLDCDYVFLDEAQDANPALAGVVEAQDAQKIMVGDRSQSIYGWRGAVDAMSNFQADHRMLLTQSFRFGPAVAEEANKWLHLLDAPLRIKGFDGIDSQLARLDEPDAILCRTNATVVAEALQAATEDKRAAIVGGTREIRAFAEAANDLKMGKGTAHPDLTAFQNWAQVQDYVENDAGGDLKVFVKLVDSYGVPTILRVADSNVEEEDADIIISTAHKSKGREWHKVRIAPDFREPAEGEDPSREECMLSYVAVTRAQYVLDNTGLAWVDRFLDPISQ